MGTSDALCVHVEVFDVRQGLTGLVQESKAHTEPFAIDDDVLLLEHQGKLGFAAIAIQLVRPHLHLYLGLRPCYREHSVAIWRANLVQQFDDLSGLPILGDLEGEPRR